MKSQTDRFMMRTRHESLNFKSYLKKKFRNEMVEYVLMDIGMYLLTVFYGLKKSDYKWSKDFQCRRAKS